MDSHSAEWVRHRHYLLSVAYHLLGSMADAEDAVQEAFLKMQAADVSDVANPRAWLTTVVSHICMDQLRSARSRRESYVGLWLPEPLVGTTYADASDQATPGKPLPLAMLVVLEQLTPAERCVFVLHDVFAMGFAQIATIIRRTPSACRQLAVRARRHVRQSTPRFDTDADELAHIVSAFLEAARTGDLDRLVSLLDPRVVFRSDGGGAVPAAPHPVSGADKVARLVAGLTPSRGVGLTAHMVPVNGKPGFLLRTHRVVTGVCAITIDHGRITTFDLVLNPAKLRHIPTEPDPDGPHWTITP